jgi:hypothetical protein
MKFFKNLLIFAGFATAAGYAFADGNCNNCGCCSGSCGQCKSVAPAVEPVAPVATAVGVPVKAPVWPAVGSDADITVAGDAVDKVKKNSDNIKIVSKIGNDLIVENNINLGMRGMEGYSFSGGANMLHPYQAPAGFNIYEGQAEMPLMHQEMTEDDGALALAMSKSDRKKPKNYAQGNSLTITQAMLDEYLDAHPKSSLPTRVKELNDEQRREVFASVNGIKVEILEEVEVADSDEVEAPREVADQVRSWVVASGQTLRQVLQDWCDKEGWDLVWATSREYPIEASAVFKGRFTDVSSALVRNFSRATPVPYAKFYKGNRVLVVSTTEE